MPTLRHCCPLIVLAVALVGCGDDDRPDAATWRDTWDSRQALVPSPAEIIEGGTDLCGELVGVFRAEMPALDPTPAEALDDAVDAWVAHAETIVFECTTDPDELAARFDTLDALADEVDAGLAAEAGDG